MGWKDTFDKLKLQFINTKSAFLELNKEKGITNAFIFLVILIIAYKIISYAAVYVLSAVLKLKSFQVPVYDFTDHFISFIYMIVGSFLIVLLLHAFIKWFKGKANLASTYKIFIYSIWPYLLLRPIPIVGRLAEALSLFFYIVGVCYIHKLKPIPAFFTFFIPLALIGALIFYLSLKSIYLFGGV